MERVNMKSLIYLVTTLMVLIMSVGQGCKYENEEELFGSEEECDVTQISYEVEIIPIVDQFCNSCHSSVEASAGVILDTYVTLKSWADESLYCTISYGDGCENMPKNQPQLSECNILKIKTWIDEGALEN